MWEVISESAEVISRNNLLLGRTGQIQIVRVYDGFHLAEFPLAESNRAHAPYHDSCTLLKCITISNTFL